ncbi:hypothetical protein [Kitasatospora sp. HPMI-4]|uniref:hypothetical protein n=1 Tax=Kitasatospora sp. HPMI-4 TaxID=3448443 RepID=UPI003F1AE585
MQIKRPKMIRAVAVGVLGTALALSTAGSAYATPLTWQGFTRDSSWDCGQAGSTVNINGLYVLPCMKVSGSSWQSILIVTGGGSTTAVQAHVTPELNWNQWGYGDCNNAGQYNIAPGQSLACFDSTRTNSGSEVSAYWSVTVWNNGVGYNQNLRAPVDFTH